jgi:glycosyltransferase involved in cell wall biosynthesis
LDIEGGFGGSSRSLYELIKNLDFNNVEVEVWCKKKGSIQDKYQSIGVKTEVFANMPKITSLPRLSRNLYTFSLFFLEEWFQSGSFRKHLKAESNRFDLIHFNHEGLFLLIAWLAKRVNIPLTMHKRTLLIPTSFAKYQSKLLARWSEGIVHITENEQINQSSLSKKKIRELVLYNVVDVEEGTLKDKRQQIIHHPFKVITLANYSYMRGIDRLIGIAERLQRKSEKDFLFIVAGNMRLSGSLPGKLQEIAARGGSLVDYAEEAGVTEMFRFTGHTSEPEKLLEEADLLIRPSRGNNPWGRDVLEAMAFGLPVVTSGEYDRFVENEVTGVLLKDFNEEQFVDKLLELRNNPETLIRLGKAARQRVSDLCFGPVQSGKLLDFWLKIRESQEE